MLKMFKKRMPMPVTINDCLLLWQMGYRVEINDGRVTAVVKESKKKTAVRQGWQICEGREIDGKINV